MPDTVFAYADWSQLETWLTAHFSGDPTLTAELEAQLAGGPKVHALNAALIYGIDPADAKRVMVDLQGRRVQAYDGGKRCGHAYNYGMDAPKMARTYWLPAAFAREVLGKLREKYAGVERWRRESEREVFGVAEYVCGRCGLTADGAGSCSRCSTAKAPAVLRWKGWKVRPSRDLRTPFGRRRLYPGKQKESANAVAAQRPQSTGISMWYRTLQRVRGYQMVNGERLTWPVPPVPHRVVWGTYDSFAVACHREDAELVLQWLLWTMEQAWPQLGGKRFPAEGLVGHNLDEFNEDCWCGHGVGQHGEGGCDDCDGCFRYEARNERGLRERVYTAFSAVNPYGETRTALSPLL
jgi:hypothetical protein